MDVSLLHLDSVCGGGDGGRWGRWSALTLVTGIRQSQISGINSPGADDGIWFHVTRSHTLWMKVNPAYFDACADVLASAAFSAELLARLWLKVTQVQNCELWRSFFNLNFNFFIPISSSNFSVPASPLMYLPGSVSVLRCSDYWRRRRSCVRAWRLEVSGSR